MSERGSGCLWLKFKVNYVQIVRIPTSSGAALELHFE